MAMDLTCATRKERPPKKNKNKKKQNTHTRKRQPAHVARVFSDLVTRLLDPRLQRLVGGAEHVDDTG